MWPVFKKEISSFFTTPVGYLVIGLFLGLSGLFLWVFKGPFNILDYGFADLSLFFLLAPWILLLLIPAVTMRSFSEEQKLGTLELLQSKPISTAALIAGKYFGALVLVLLAILPTLLYVAAINDLGIRVGNLDAGLIWGSYGGLLLLIALYVSIGLLCSTLTENQIVAFLGAILLCFLLYYGFESLSSLFSSGDKVLGIQNLGIKAHYERISQGIVDSRDLLYFFTLIAFFIFLSINRLNHLKK